MQIHEVYTSWFQMFAKLIISDMDSADKKYDKLVGKIAANIANIRKSRRLTQEQMVDYGYSYRHYQRIEGGKHSPSLYTLFRLAQTFKVEIRDFFK